MIFGVRDALTRRELQTEDPLTCLPRLGFEALALLMSLAAYSFPKYLLGALEVRPRGKVLRVFFVD